MKRFALVLTLLLSSCSNMPTSLSQAADRISWPAGLPVYDHVVIVVEENKDYEQIIDNPAAHTSTRRCGPKAPISPGCMPKSTIARGTTSGCFREAITIRILDSTTAFLQLG